MNRTAPVGGFIKAQTSAMDTSRFANLANSTEISKMSGNQTGRTNQGAPESSRFSITGGDSLSKTSQSLK